MKTSRTLETTVKIQNPGYLELFALVWSMPIATVANYYKFSGFKDFTVLSVEV